MSSKEIPAQVAPAAQSAEHRRFVDRLLSPRAVGLPLLIAVVLLAPLFLSSGFHYDIAILIGINAVVVIGLNLLMGYAGQISLGHAGFFGIGAYVTAILCERLQWHGLLALAAGAAAAAVVAFIVARPILRLSGHYLAMATLGMGMIIFIIITNESQFTGGPDGMGVPPLEVFGYVVRDAKVWYWIIGALLILNFWLALNLVDSPVGRALRAVHGSEIAANTAGIDVIRYKVLVFVVSAGMAALMGGLFAFYSGFIAPNSADFMHSIIFAVMVVFGGMGSVVGAVVGAAALTLLPQYLTTFAEYEWLLYGVVLMAVMIFMPAGLMPTLAAWIRRVAR